MNLSQLFCPCRKKISLLILAVLLLMFNSCREDMNIQPYTPDNPAHIPVINRDLLVSGGDYSVGYLNGNIQSKRITLSWTVPDTDDLLCVKILRNGTLLKTFNDVSENTYIDSVLIQNNYYKYSVAVINRSGMHRLDTILLKTPRFTPPRAEFQVLLNNKLKITWVKSAESATSYVLVKSLSSSPTVYDTLAVLTDTVYIDSSVTSGGVYNYRIEARSPYETTGFSSPATAVYVYTMDAPVLNPLQQTTGHKVQLSWEDYSSAEEGFKIYRRRGTDGKFDYIDSVPGNVESYIDADTSQLKPDSTYYYYVQGYNQQDTTPSSNIRNITIFSIASTFTEDFESGQILSPWITGGYAGWGASSVLPYAGQYSARSGVIGSNQFTYLQRTLFFSGTKTISFKYRVSSEGFSDRLVFSINGSVINVWSGETGWEQFSTQHTGTGQVLLKWEYMKDGSINSGSDAAWIDNIVVQ